MASPKRTKVSIFPQSEYLIPNVASSGRAYQVFGDGSWSPIIDHKTSDEQLVDAEAPLSSAITTVTRAWESTYTRAMRTHSKV